MGNMTAAVGGASFGAMSRLRGIGLAVAVLGWGGACAPPDRPPRLPDALPSDVAELLEPDSSRVIRVADGVFYRYLWSPKGPWGVHLLEADAGACPPGLRVVRAPRQEGLRGGFARVTELAAASGAEVLAAVNGDFFTPEGMPLGPEVSDGVRRTGRTRPALVSGGGGSDPWIGVTGVQSGRVVAADRVLRPETGGSAQVLGGFPELLEEGRRVGDLLVEGNPAFAARRHPRTAVGLSTDDDRLWFVVVDGRRSGYSEGMSLPELTALLEALGVEEALNLDGGGSSVLVVKGRVVSRPSDDTGERPVVNALLLVEDGSVCGAEARIDTGGAVTP